MKRQVIIRYTLEKEDTKEIQAYMKRNHISIRALAKFLGYSPTFVCDMLNGKAYVSDKFHVWINVNLVKYMKVVRGRGNYEAFKRTK